MYSGTTLRNSSGQIMGAHQKLDRVARRALEQLVPGSNFPKIREILHFEGRNGPDGIKSKSPGQDEPWHFYDPTNPDDTRLTDMIIRHSRNLTTALKAGELEKAAFEAAWQAHAIADGLTPAHHLSSEKWLAMRGADTVAATSVKDKLIIRSEGDSASEMLAKNWEMWGAGGHITTHGTYEWGVATTIAPLRLKAGYPTSAECRHVLDVGIVPIFTQAAKDIYELKMYDRFMRKGWTRKLARETREVLGPQVVKVIALAWYEALVKSQDK
jgi:hypothetical protein